MEVFNFMDVEAVEADEGSSKLKVRWLITKETGAQNFAMRLFEVEHGGYSPYHKHPWEHEVFILEGEGLVRGEKSEHRFKKGMVIYVHANELHQFENTDQMPLRFLCMVPLHD